MAGPAGTVIGRLLVKVVPDTSKFRQELEREFASVNDEFEVRVKPVVDETAARATETILNYIGRDRTVRYTAVFTGDSDAFADERGLPAGGSGGAGGAGGGGGGAATPGSSDSGGGGDDLEGKIAKVRGYQAEIEAFLGRLGGPIAQGGAIISIVAIVAASMSAIVGGAILLPGLIAAALAPIAVLLIGIDGVKVAFEGLSPEFANVKTTLDQINQQSFGPLVDALNLLAPILQGSANQLGTAFGTIVGAIATFIAGNIPEIQLLFTNLAAATEALAPFIGIVLELLLQFLNFILPFIPPFLEQLTAGLADMGGGFEGIAPLIAVAIQDFGSLFVGILQALPLVIASIIIFSQNAQLFFNLIGSVLRTLLVAAMTVFNGISSAIASARAAFDREGGGIMGALQAVQAFVIGVVATIIGFFGQLVVGVGAAIGNVLNVIAKFIPGLQGAADAFSNFVDDARRYVATLPDKIIGIFDDLPGKLTNIGGDIIDGFIEGLRSGFDRVQGTLDELTAKIPDWKGPALRDAHLLDEPADLIMGGFTKRIEHNFGDVRRTFGQVPIDIEPRAEAPAAGGVQQTFMVDPRADGGFVEQVATTAYRASTRALNLRFGRV